MMLLSLLLLVVSSTFVIGQTWVRDHNDDIPPYAVQGGNDQLNYGRYLYVCKGYVMGEPGSGKVANNLDRCKIPWGNQELSTRTYDVLTNPPWDEFSLDWSTKKYSKGNVPSNAVAVAYGIYVGRYKRSGYYIPGKVVSQHKALFYGYDGKEYYKRRGYEVLTKNSRTIYSYRLQSLSYDFSKAIETVSPISLVLASKSVSNDSPSETTVTVTLDVPQSTTSEWTETDDPTIISSRGWSVYAGIPKTNPEQPSGWEVGPTKTYTYSYGKSYESSVTTTYTVSVNIPANSKADVSIMARETNVEVPFSCTLRMYYGTSGYGYANGVSGVYKDVHYTAFQTLVNGKPVD